MALSVISGVETEISLFREGGRERGGKGGGKGVFHHSITYSVCILCLL